MKTFFSTSLASKSDNKRIRLELTGCTSGESALYADTASFHEHKCVLAGWA
jgi:hypothetical protein